MPSNRNLRSLLPACAVAVTLLLLAGCGVQSYSLSVAPPELRLVTAAGSDWQTDQLTASVVPSASGWQLSIASTAAQPAGTLLLEAHFAPEFSATQVERLTPDGKLCLLVADRPGVLALGVIMPDGETIAPGELLQAKLVRSSSAARSASKVPAGGAGQVPDLVGVEDGVGGYNLSWSYYNIGDYDQNSEANIADLTPLATHLGHSTASSDHAGLDAVLDGDSNTEVNIADLTPLGVNFLSRVDGYRLFRADGPDPGTATSTQIAEMAFADSQPPNNGRRLFQMAAPQAELQIGAYYFAKPFEQASGEEGAPSNAVQFTAIASMKFRVPPVGSSIADSGQAQNPSLVLMPAIAGLSQEGAPVVVYTTLGGGGVTPLLLAYYNGSAWVNEDIGGGDNYSMPKAAWIPGAEGAPGQGLVMTYDINSLSLVCIHFDESWLKTGTETIDTETGVFSRLAFDRDPATGQLGVAHAYTGLGSNIIVYSYSDAGGAWTTEPVSSVSDTFGGLTFRFDPSGGDPWLLYTHGTFSTSPTISLQYTLEQARRTGGTWNVSTVPYPDSPVFVDLGFRSDGTPQLACVAARDYTINIPTLDPVTISLLFDVISGEYGGASWSWKKPFESTFGISLGGGFPPTTLVLELNLATDTSWAKPDELICSQSAGSIEINISDYMPQDGALTPDTQFMRRDAGGSYSEVGYYGGGAGRSFAWAQNNAGSPVCAFVRSTDITAQDVLAGNFEAAGELTFWHP